MVAVVLGAPGSGKSTVAVVLDCADSERWDRLATRMDGAEVADALADAEAYRSLGMPIIDTTGRSVDAVVADLVPLVESS